MLYNRNSPANAKKGTKNPPMPEAARGDFDFAVRSVSVRSILDVINGIFHCIGSLFDEIGNLIGSLIHSFLSGIGNFFHSLPELHAVVSVIALLTAGDIVQKVIIVKLAAIEAHLTLAVLLLQNEDNRSGSCNGGRSNDCKNLPVHGKCLFSPQDKNLPSAAVRVSAFLQIYILYHI